MTSVQVLAALGNLAFVVAMLAVALRLLFLWHRTRRLPELAVAGGFLLVAGVGFPLTAAGGIGRPHVADVDLVLVGLGLASIGLGVGALNVFTWRVFRPGAGWAGILALASLAAALGVCAGALHALASAPADAEPIAAGGTWWMGIRLLFEIWYVWTAAESLREYAMARRRLALGLSDPVLANRFLLWGTMGAFLAVNNVVAIALETAGRSPVDDPAAALVLAANGLVAAGLMVLTFMPPSAYTSFIRRRATAAA